MRLIAKRDLCHPINKKKGEEFEIADGFAQTLTLIGFAEVVPDKPAKRKYQRRDMTAIDDRMMDKTP